MGDKTSAETISKEDFSRFLDEYSALIKDISSTKPVKAGQKTLQQLDECRYTDAVNTFSLPNPKRAMTLNDVKSLVEWKLRHGKFRPTLMNLVSSNDASSAASTIEEAFKGYKSSSDIPTCLSTLCKLRGIGPATASLLLSVYDPTRVLFFSDEAFWWLCCDGKKGTIKYNNKEYDMLRSRAAKLVKRLGVEATDVEKVAYVLMKKDAAADNTSAKTAPKKLVRATKAEPPKPSKPTKRKDTGDQKETEIPVGTRRSKRVKS